MSMDKSSCSSTSGYSRPLGYPSDETTTIHNREMVSNARSYSYSRFGDDVSTTMEENGWDRGDFSPKENRPYMIRWKSGKKVDQSLLILLESYFQELYVKRNEFFRKIFPELYDQFVEVFKKIGTMLSNNNNNQAKYKTMQRSLSLGSPGSSETRLEWFKVKTPDVIVAQPGGGGQGDTDNNGITSTVSSATPK